MSDDRALIIGDADRQTIYGLITAALGSNVTVTPDEFTYFIRVAELRGLNPLFREVHLIKDRTGRINVQVGIDGFRKLAELSGDYAGQTDAVFDEPYTGPVIEWQGKPNHCKVGVLRHSFESPVYGEAWLDEDGARKIEWQGPAGQREPVPTNHAEAQWAQRPRTMLRKVAEARAIRAAFPKSVAGLYTDDEMHAGTAVPALTAESTAADPAMVTNPRAFIAPASDGGEQPVEGTWRPPEPPEGTEAVLREAPDGVRQSKSQAHPPRWEGVAPKLEVKVKVKNRNHTLFLLGDLAYAADAAGLMAEERVIYQGGQVIEREWAEGKPKIKEVFGITGLLVFREGDWRPIEKAETPQPQTEMPLVDSTAEPEAPPLEPAPEPTPEPTPEPKAPMLVQGEEVHARIRLTGPITTGTTPRGTNFARVDGVILETGEIVKCVLGDEPAGEIAAQLERDGGGWLFGPDDEVVIVGVVKADWVILTYIGRPAS